MKMKTVSKFRRYFCSWVVYFFIHTCALYIEFFLTASGSFSFWFYSAWSLIVSLKWLSPLWPFFLANDICLFTRSIFKRRFSREQEPLTFLRKKVISPKNGKKENVWGSANGSQLILIHFGNKCRIQDFKKP